MKVLLILADDLGLELFDKFGRGDFNVTTPTLDKWYDDGLRFTQFMVQQLCSPTRATIQTGVHVSVHGIGDLVRDTYGTQSLTPGMPKGLWTIPELLKLLGVPSAAFGKWHLSDYETSPEHVGARLQGYEHWSGNEFNLGLSSEGYYDYDRRTNGELQRITGQYMTKVVFDEAADWMRSKGDTDWFCYVAPYSCHVPLSTGIPPTGTYNAGIDTTTEFGRNKACMEALDYYMTRCLARLPQHIKDDLVVIFCTDNGSPRAISSLVTDPVTGTAYPAAVADVPYGRSFIRGKDTPFRSGINTPLLIYSPDHVVSGGRTVTHPVSAVDLAPTICALFGQTALPIGARHDGRSLAGYIANTQSTQLNQFVYSEHFLQNGATQDVDRTESFWSIFDGQYSLVSWQELNDPVTYRFLFDDTNDPHQLVNLLEGGDPKTLSSPQRTAYEALLSARTAIQASAVPSFNVA